MKVAEHAPDIVRNVILKHQPVSEQDERDVQSGKVDADSIVAHKVKVGRWRRDVLQVVGDKRCWSVVEASFRARIEIDHIHALLQEELQDTDKKGHHLRCLACGRADALIDNTEK